MLREKGEVVAKKYVDKVNLGVDGWKIRYYKDKFHICQEEVEDFL